MPQIHRMRLLIATGLVGIGLTAWASPDPGYKSAQLLFSPCLGILLGLAVLVSIHPRPRLARMLLLPILGGALSWGIGFLGAAVCAVPVNYNGGPAVIAQAVFVAVLIALLSWTGALAYLSMLVWTYSYKQRWDSAARAACRCLPAFLPLSVVIALDGGGAMTGDSEWGRWALLLGILLWWAGFVGALIRQEEECKAVRELGLVK